MKKANCEQGEREVTFAHLGFVNVAYLITMIQLFLLTT